jgi:hypothetical protein
MSEYNNKIIDGLKVGEAEEIQGHHAVIAEMLSKGC